METLAFRDFMYVIIECFGYIYTSGTMLIQFLITPISESFGNDVLEFLGDFAEYTPLELMFGVGLIAAIGIILVRFVFIIF